MRSSEKSQTGREADERTEHSAVQPVSPPEISLYFFPDQAVTESEARSLLREGTLEERAWVVSHILSFALWDDIWNWINREQVCEVFPHLEMPESLRQAWARLLKIEAP